MDIPTYLTNHQLVVAFFGYWPGFHDAEVAAYTGLTSEANSLRFTLHTWEMTSEIDAKGYFVLTKHALVEFEFNGVRDAEMDAFSSDNILFGLGLNQDADSCRIYVELDSVMDKSGSFTANSGAVLSIMPCTPDGLVLSPVRTSL